MGAIPAEKVYAPLYHYCDVHAFKSIIENNEIWLCPFVYSNDALEGRAWRPILVKLMQEAGLKPDETEINECIEVMYQAAGCYGMSFSEVPDLLSQWRGYAAGGSGFSIGFDKAVLSNLPKIPSATLDWQARPVEMHRVSYTEEESTVKVRKLFSAVQEFTQKQPRNALAKLSALANNDKNVINAMSVARIDLFKALIEQWAALFSVKTDVFAEEREWRLATTPFHDDMELSYRVSRGRLVPYLKIKLPPDAILDVYLGPKNETDDNVVKRFLKQHIKTPDGFPLRIQRSRASYR